MHVVLLHNIVQSVLVHSRGYSLQYSNSGAGLACKFARLMLQIFQPLEYITTASCYNKSHNAEGLAPMVFIAIAFETNSDQ